MMMTAAQPGVITPEHLQRNAYLYVRQSSLRQVLEHGESTNRQYALSDRALALGWSRERIVTIDEDLGLSGSTAENRDGFKKLVAEVGMGHAGIVIGIEVSRLARNSSDWHRLLEICALTETLILDEDGLYDPNGFNDRLVLGLKGTMSEAELHYLKARMWGGRLAKAKRGQLRTPLPIGFVYDDEDAVILDPDQQVRQVISTFFEVFSRTRSARATMQHFHTHHILFPSRLLRGARKGELVWVPLLYTRAIAIVHNPRYAGVFSYGRVKTRRTAAGTMKYLQVSRENWHACIRDAHPGYIPYEQWLENQRILQANSQSYGPHKRGTPPREGSALLQGIVLCGICGRRMHVQYRTRSGRSEGNYVCRQFSLNRDLPQCQWICGKAVDAAVSELLLQSFTPLAVEVALGIQEELKRRYESLDRLRTQHIKRLEYEADMARRRYMQVDPQNRLVADTLEAEWNTKLNAVKDAHEQYHRRREQDLCMVDEKEKREIIALATDFPRLWNNPNTSHRDRKRIVRYLIEDVTLTRTDDRYITIQTRFKGGAAKTVSLPLPVPATEMYRTSREVIERVDALLETHHDSGVAQILNAEGFLTTRGTAFAPSSIGHIRRIYRLKSFYDRMHDRGQFTANEVAKRLGISHNTVYLWVKNGIIEASTHPERRFYVCTVNPKQLQEKLTDEYHAGRTTRHFYTKMMTRLHEVQYEL